MFEDYSEISFHISESEINRVNTSRRLVLGSEHTLDIVVEDVYWNTTGELEVVGRGSESHIGLRHWGDSLAVFNLSNVNPSPRIEAPDPYRIQIPTEFTSDDMYDENVNIQFTSELGYPVVNRGEYNVSEIGDRSLHHLMVHTDIANMTEAMAAFQYERAPHIFGGDSVRAVASNNLTDAAESQVLIYDMFFHENFPMPTVTQIFISFCPKMFKVFYAG